MTQRPSDREGTISRGGMEGTGQGDEEGAALSNGEEGAVRGGYCRRRIQSDQS
jgi:hypothetical protein